MKKILYFLLLVLPLITQGQSQSITMQFRRMDPQVNTLDSVYYTFPGKIGGYSWLWNAEKTRSFVNNKTSYINSYLKHYADSLYARSVNLFDDQTIAGNKTYTGDAIFSGPNLVQFFQGVGINAGVKLRFFNNTPVNVYSVSQPGTGHQLWFTDETTGDIIVFEGNTIKDRTNNKFFLKEGDAVVPDSNLNDVSNKATARANLGINLQNTTALGNSTNLDIIQKRNYSHAYTQVGDTIVSTPSKFYYTLGDSFTAGTGASNPTNRFSTVAATNMGLLERNRGIGGTTLQLITPGDSSAIDRLPSKSFLPIYNSSTMRYLQFEYGMNDLGLANDTTNFKVAYNRVLDTATVRGWPMGSVILIGVGFTANPNTAVYTDVIRRLSIARGTLFVDIRAAEIAGGGASLLFDGLHPNDFGHMIIATRISEAIAGLHGGNLSVRGVLHSIGANILQPKSLTQVLPAALTITDNVISNLNIAEIRGSSTLGNLGFGYYSLSAITTGTGNLFSGFNAGRNLTTGNFNSVYGYTAGLNMTTGSSNAYFGREVGFKTTTGNGNTGVGYKALDSLDIGLNNTAIGNGSLFLNKASNNSAFGTNSLANNTTGVGLVSGGYQAGFNNTLGNNNTDFGFQAGFGRTTGGNDVNVGYQAGFTNIGSNFQTYIGYKAGFSHTTNDYNSAVGYSSLSSDVSGTFNTALGSFSANGNLTGNSITAIGYGAVKTSTASSNITAVGTNSMASGTGGNTTAVGFESLQRVTGTGNTGMGYKVLDSLKTGTNNVGIGSVALFGNIAGSGNVAVGANSGQLLTSSNNTLLGNLSGNNITTGASNITIGNGSAGGVTTGSNNTIIGSVGGLSSSLANTVILSDGAGNIVMNVNGSTGRGQNLVMATPNGSTGAGTYRALVSADIPASVSLTGTPTVPTAAPGTNTTQAASTAFVTAAVAAAAGGTVTSITPGYGFTSATPITTSGTLIVDSSKFVTTATAQNITGSKVFTSNQLFKGLSIKFDGTINIKPTASAAGPAGYGGMYISAIATDRIQFFTPSNNFTIGNTGASGFTLLTNNTSPRGYNFPDVDGVVSLARSGSFSGAGTATTTFTVSIGVTQASNSYRVNVTPTSALSAALFYINNKTTTTFDVVYLTGLTGAVSFDWSVFNN